MNFQLQYLDAQGQHLDVNEFENLNDAMQIAEKCSWAHSFEIMGMGQHLRGVREDESITWLGVQKG